MTDYEITESTPHVVGNSVYWTHKTWIIKGESRWSKFKKFIRGEKDE